MKVLGQRADGVLLLSLGGSLRMLYHPDGVRTPALDRAEADAYGPFAFRTADEGGTFALERHLDTVRVVPVQLFVLHKERSEYPGDKYPSEADGKDKSAKEPKASEKEGGTKDEGPPTPRVESQGEGRPPVYHVKSIDEAVDHILAGKVVELADIKSVNTLLDKMAAMALEAKAAGKDAPNFDLCNVSVANTNLFCVDKLRDATYPNGVPRWQMPQIGGKTIPGTKADALPHDKNGEVDGSKHFLAHLMLTGLKTTEEKFPAAKLKATQMDLVGSNVAGMMTANPTDFDPAKQPIFVSRDNYVLDGHHRWAAVVGKDAEDGVLGTSTMNIIRIDAPIAEILPMAQEWSKAFGIQQKAAGKSGQQKLAERFLRRLFLHKDRSHENHWRP